MSSRSKYQRAKTKLLEKVILEDEEYILIASIPMMIPKLDSGSQNIFKLHESKERSQRFINKNKKIIEYNIDALKPTFLRYNNVGFEVDSTFIDIAVEEKHRLIVFPITCIFHKYFPIIPVSNISRELILPGSNYQAIIQDIAKRTPHIGFRNPELVLLTNLDTKVHANITPTSIALNYVMALTPSFFPVREVDSKRLDLSAYTKRSSTTLAKEEVAMGGASEDLDELLQLPDIFEKLFGVSAKQLIVVDRPVVIFAEKSSDPKYNYIEFLKRVLRELYRVYQGGLPNPSTISTSLEEVKLKIKAGGHVYTLDLDSMLEQEREREHFRYLVDRLEELYSQGLGYLVLYGTGGTLEKLEKLGLAITHLRLRNVKEEPHSVQARKRKLWIIPKPVELRINEDKSVYCIVNLMWGRILNACRDTDALVNGGVVLDYYAATREDEYYREIARIAYDPEVNLTVEPSSRGRGELERESVVHYALKALAVMHVRDHEGIPESDIHTEYDMGDIVLDVYARHSKLGDLAIEVETLYGTTLPLLKLRKTIESRLSKGLRTWIIIPSPQFFLFLPWIAKLREVYRKREKDNIEFFTIDLERKKIISFKELMRITKSLYAKSHLE